MTTNQQRREAAKRKLERQQERREEQAKRRRRTVMITAIGVVVVVVAAIIVVTKLGGSSSGTDAAAAASCQFTATPDQPAAKPAPLPASADPPRSGTVNVNIKTDRGDIPLTLDQAKAPCTVASFLNLVNAKFFDNTPCPRLVTSDGLKVLQCGDPTGQGSGGPGYTIPDEKPTGLATAPGSTAHQPVSVYPRGVIAMANTGSPNSGGSQFFLVYGDSTLPPDYTIFGTIGAPGLTVLDAVGAKGDDGSNQAGGGKPKESVTVAQATTS